MSKTDKDMPYWVTATWWKPSHHRCQYTQIYSTTLPRRVCDLPPEPKLTDHHNHPRRWLQPGCIWMAVWERRHWPNPPHWYITHTWHAPQRQLARMQGRKALKEWNGSGDTDVVATTDQARHCSRWLWY